MNTFSFYRYTVADHDLGDYRKMQHLCFFCGHLPLLCWSVSNIAPQHWHRPWEHECTSGHNCSTICSIRPREFQFKHLLVFLWILAFIIIANMEGCQPSPKLEMWRWNSVHDALHSNTHSRSDSKGTMPAVFATSSASMFSKMGSSLSECICRQK